MHYGPSLLDGFLPNNQALLRASVTSAIKDVLVLRRAIILRMKAGPKPSY